MKNLSLLIFLQLLFMTEAFACNCLPTSSNRESKTTASHIFSGVVMEKVKYTIDGAGNPISEVLVTLRVHQIWKGDKAEVIQVRTPALENSCGLNFEVGKKYLVYATGGKVPISNRCNRTSLHFETQAQVDIDYLKDPKYIIVKK